MNTKTAQVVLAEAGTDITRFPTDRHLSSWAGICPGQNESAGKRHSGKTRKGNRWLRQARIEAAHGAARSKDTYLAAQYQRLAARRGKKRAALAVAYTILVIAYHVLRRRGSPIENSAPISSMNATRLMFKGVSFNDWKNWASLSNYTRRHSFNRNRRLCTLSLEVCLPEEDKFSSSEPSWITARVFLCTRLTRIRVFLKSPVPRKRHAGICAGAVRATGRPTAMPAITRPSLP